jgi:hypothetical protein
MQVLNIHKVQTSSIMLYKIYCCLQSHYFNNYEILFMCALIRSVIETCIDSYQLQFGKADEAFD